MHTRDYNVQRFPQNRQSIRRFFIIYLLYTIAYIYIRPYGNRYIIAPIYLSTVM